ncbi:starch synthase [Paracoccus halophilus]|uniref:Glycogen synthase n=1 Tax=Paracoccus halophilus TaxID=376733 RepID=A0A099EZ26_9RHOB|nr:glycogen synthase GlgA [Paracoccus halophilus]KGJ03705.1 glycogen synthase [Paracoccus halophilus]SFA57307.1 starch synthase [Paracoccus halophilus]
MTRVLSVTSECVPLIKTGGLADVAGALPGALAGHGVAMRTLLPGYRAVLAAQGDAPVVMDLGDLFGGPARIRQGALGDAVLYVLDAPYLFDRDAGPYLGADGRDWPDNPQRFAALCRAAALIARDGIGDWRPQVLHLHDWQAGLTPVYLRQLEVGDVRTLLTIHNIAFQGLAPAHMLSALHLPAHLFTPHGFEYWGRISALKAGIVFADKVSTVSPTYAEELMTPEFGMGMQGVLASRASDFAGILNGIDLDVWTPPYPDPAGKAAFREALRAEFGLPGAEGPLCVAISRLSGQKGLDLLIEALPALLEQGGQLAVLGSGDPAIEAALRAAAARHPTGVALRVGYDEALAHRMIAGGDAILVPSRFEPCGLTQLYGLRFGTLPVVSLTGGLADTVINASTAALRAGVATGLQFHPVTARALSRALVRLCALYRQPELWQRMARNAMAQPVGWDASAASYAELFYEMTTAE